MCRTAAKFVGDKNAPSAVTLGFIALWYSLNVGFNLTNKSLFNIFPFPWFVSTIHVVVGTVYCGVTYLLGAKDASFQRVITKEEFKKILGPASMHAMGHVAANLSFAAVAISLTHTVKTLEPLFNVVLSQLILGAATPLSVMASLIPVIVWSALLHTCIVQTKCSMCHVFLSAVLACCVLIACNHLKECFTLFNISRCMQVGVALASAAELSFNWLGFISAMMSNLTFGFRAVWTKAALASIKDLGSTAIYAYTTLISVFICAPGIIFFEGAKLGAGINNAISIVGAQGFYLRLLAVGLLYHLYNQFAFNTLGRVTPVSHGVCNVVKRIVIIGSSVVFFGNKLSTQTQAGTVVALAGTWLYSEMVKREKIKGNVEPPKRHLT